MSKYDSRYTSPALETFCQKHNIDLHRIIFDNITGITTDKEKKEILYYLWYLPNPWQSSNSYPSYFDKVNPYKDKFIQSATGNNEQEIKDNRDQYLKDFNKFFRGALGDQLTLYCDGDIHKDEEYFNDTRYLFYLYNKITIGLSNKEDSEEHVINLVQNTLRLDDAFYEKKMDEAQIIITNIKLYLRHRIYEDLRNLFVTAFNEYIEVYNKDLKITIEERESNEKSSNDSEILNPPLNHPQRKPLTGKPPLAPRKPISKLDRTVNYHQNSVPIIYDPTIFNSNKSLNELSPRGRPGTARTPSSHYSHSAFIREYFDENYINPESYLNIKLLKYDSKIEIPVDEFKKFYEFIRKEKSHNIFHYPLIDANKEAKEAKYQRYVPRLLKQKMRDEIDVSNIKLTNDEEKIKIIGTEVAIKKLKTLFQNYLVAQEQTPRSTITKNCRTAEPLVSIKELKLWH